MCGKKFTIFATESGKVFGMGDNKNGELGSSAAGACRAGIARGCV